MNIDGPSTFRAISPQGCTLEMDGHWRVKHVTRTTDDGQQRTLVEFIQCDEDGYDL